MGTDSIIYFRTDGNSAIATGHIMRCLSIARAITMSKHPQICFLLSDKESLALLQGFFHCANEFPTIILANAAYYHLEDELPELITLLLQSSENSYQKPVLFLDSYYVTQKYLNAVADISKVAYLDDLQLFDYPVDLIINYDVIPTDSLTQYRNAYSRAKKVLLGASYTPLRQQFWTPFAPTKEKINIPRLLITSGGSDPYHTCLHLLSYLKNHFSETIAFHVVIGSLNSDKNALYELAASCPFIVLHENVSDMAELMASCSFAVSAAGTTLYELCASGVPTASFVLADNQITAARAFEKAGAIPLLGDVRTEESAVFEALENWLTKIIKSPLMQQEASQKMKALVDGKGALRIADELLIL